MCLELHVINVFCLIISCHSCNRAALPEKLTNQESTLKRDECKSYYEHGFLKAQHFNQLVNYHLDKGEQIPTLLT